MARTYTKGRNDPWPTPGPGDSILLAAGVHGPAEFSACPDLTIQGYEGAIIEGSLTPRGGEPATTLRFHDGSHRLKIRDLEIRGSNAHGLHVTGAEGVSIQDVKSYGHGAEGIILGDCPNSTLARLECYGSRAGDKEYTPDKRHGLYISGNASGTLVTDLHSHSVTGSGFQANGPGMGAIITNLHVSEMLLEKCGSGGTPPLSLMGVQDSVFEQFCITDVPGDRWAVLFADGMGEEFACRDNIFRTYSVPAGSIASEEEGSSGQNSFRPGAGWSPGPQQPPVDPTPKPDPLEAIRAAALAGQTALSLLRGDLQPVRMSKRARKAIGGHLDGADAALAQIGQRAAG